jgi:hypothetical protein
MANQISQKIYAMHDNFHRRFYSAFLPLLQANHDEAYIEEQKKILIQLITENHQEAKNLLQTLLRWSSAREQ